MTAGLIERGGRVLKVVSDTKCIIKYQLLRLFMGRVMGRDSHRTRAPSRCLSLGIIAIKYDTSKCTNNSMYNNVTTPLSTQNATYTKPHQHKIK